MFVLTQHHSANRILLQVQRHAEGIIRELNHFTVHDIGQTVNAHDAVGEGDHRAFVARFANDFETLDALFDEIANF